MDCGMRRLAVAMAWPAASNSTALDTVRPLSQRLGGLLFLFMSLFYGAQIGAIPQLPVDRLEAMNARTLPWLLCGAGVLLSLLLIVFGGRPAATAHSGVSVIRMRDAMVALVLLGWTACYAWLLQVLGFWGATALFLLVGFEVLGYRRPGRALVIALAAASGLWALLRFGLGLYLPAGTLW